MNILIADGKGLLCAGLRALLDDHPDAEVIADTPDGREVVHLAKQLRPDIVVVFFNLQGLNGIDATREIKQLDAPPGVVMISERNESAIAAAARNAGVDCYMLHTCDADELHKALDYAARRETYFSPPVEQQLREHPPGNPHPVPVYDRLTPREREVLQLLAEGLSTPKIAARLHISERTVSTHRHHILRKLDAGNIAGLVKYAIRAGLASVEE